MLTLFKNLPVGTSFYVGKGPGAQHYVKRSSRTALTGVNHSHHSEGRWFHFGTNERVYAERGVQ